MHSTHVQRLSSADRKAAFAFAALGSFAFALAGVINPYEKAGVPLSHGSHTQVGLPPCAFYAATQYPCPGCGLTTSFALLVRGDVRKSLSVNEAGIFVAAFSGIALLYFTAAGVSGFALRGVGIDKPLVWFVCSSAIVVLTRYASILYANRKIFFDSACALSQQLL